MIQLIASDIDGTLLPKGQTELDADTLQTVSQILDSGMEFCAISGRPRSSVLHLFAPVADRIWVISDNGTILWEKGTAGAIAKLFEIPRAQAHALAQALVSLPCCEVTISTSDGHFLWAKKDELWQQLSGILSAPPRRIADFSEVTGAITKVSAYCYDLAAPHIAAFTEEWGGIFQVAQSDLEWIDFTFGNKGTGLAELCHRLRISSRNAAAFGDNFNDLPMLELARYPFLHTSAHPELLARIPAHRATLRAVFDSVKEVNRCEDHPADPRL